MLVLLWVLARRRIYLGRSYSPPSRERASQYEPPERQEQVEEVEAEEEEEGYYESMEPREAPPAESREAPQEAPQEAPREAPPAAPTSAPSEDTSAEAAQEAAPPDELDLPLELGEERYADFTFYHDGYRTRTVSSEHALQAEQWYQLEVAVRVEPTGIPPEALERYPIREPKQREAVRIMVATEGDGFEIQEPVQTLVLPPQGDSIENAWFRVRPLRRSADSTDLASLRVRLYYEFNLLEVALICAEVVGRFESPADSKRRLDGEYPIWFRQERIERRYMNFDDIRPRAMHVDITKIGDAYQFSFAFYNDANEEVVFAAPARLRPTDLEDALVNVRGILYRIAMSKSFTERVQGNEEEFRADIRELARAGRRLWAKVFRRDLQGSLFQIGRWLEEHPLKPGGIVQVSVDANAADFVFPWALLYDREVPMREYELPDPEGFWGLRYCVEQQLPYGAKKTDEPFRLEDKLKLDFMLWEHFRNADEQKSLMARLADQSTNRIDVSVPPITDAVTCYESLSNCDGHIVYFYTHGYTRRRHSDIGVGHGLELFKDFYERLDDGDPRRERYKELYNSIKQGQFESDRSWIELTYGKVYLDDLWDYVFNSFRCSPIVALNMCESAQVTPSLSESFVEFFLDRGAASVIGTECPMTVEFAHPFAEKLLESVLSGNQVGTAMLEARRYFMNERRNPLGLAYTLFGSATTRFEPAPIAMNTQPGDG